MELKTYKHIEDNIHLLEIDYHNGVVINRKTARNRYGYEYIWLRNKPIMVHNIMAYIMGDKESVGKVVNHIDGDKANNKPNNLEIVTQRENVIHSIRTGLRKPRPKQHGQSQGERNGRAILNEVKVLEIRKLIESGMGMSKIAKEFKISRHAVWDIKNKRTWKHI